MLARLWTNRNSHSLWVGIQNGTAALEDTSVVSDRTAMKTLNTTNPVFFLTTLHFSICPVYGISEKITVFLVVI